MSIDHKGPSVVQPQPSGPAQAARNGVSQSGPRLVVREPGRGLILIVPPNPADVRFRRYYLWGTFACALGLAAAVPWGTLLRTLVAVAGIPFAYWQANTAVDNPVVPVRFLFQPGLVIVSRRSGKKLFEGPVSDCDIELQRQAKTGPGRFEWRPVGGSMALDLAHEDFELLKEYGLRWVRAAAAPLSATFTSHQRRTLWAMLPIWSGPWWIVLAQLVFQGTR